MSAPASRSMASDYIRGARILVVDDQPAIRYVVRKCLAAHDVQVIEAENGAEALRQLANHAPDLVLMDIDMPVMNGLEACRQLRAHPTLGQTPLVFLAASDDDERQAGALMAGADDFVAKPFTADILLARVATQLRRRRTELEAQRLHAMVRRYVPLPVRDGAPRQGVERVTATVVFSDLRGFTATSVVQAPEQVFAAISDVLAAQTEAVVRHGGYVDKFSGDGLLAVFDGVGSELAACRAAIDIVVWARTFEGISFWQPPPIGLGIHTGPLLRGDLGGEVMREYTVLGTTVNVAARLCGVAQALEVIVSPEVAAQVAGELTVGTPRAVALKGLSANAAVFPLTTPA